MFGRLLAFASVAGVPVVNYIFTHPKLHPFGPFHKICPYCRLQTLQFNFFKYIASILHCSLSCNKYSLRTFMALAKYNQCIFNVSSSISGHLTNGDTFSNPRVVSEDSTVQSNIIISLPVRKIYKITFEVQG